MHLSHPFHRVRYWNGLYFHHAELWRVGIKIYMGHDGNPCPAGTSEPVGSMSGNPQEPTRDSDMYFSEEAGHEEQEEPHEGEDDIIGPLYQRAFKRMPTRDNEGNPFVTFVDILGVHQIPVVRCHCRETAEDLLFMEQSYFPASFVDIRTVFTFSVLKDYNLANLECKTSAFQYYQKLCRITSPTFLRSVPNRYREFRRITRQWRNLTLHQKAGRGHECGEGKAGEMALFCAACPQPGINLDENWMSDVNKCVLFLFKSMNLFNDIVQGMSISEVWLLMAISRRIMSSKKIGLMMCF
jgi:hypothetical protein